MRVSVILSERVHMDACECDTEGDSAWMRPSVTLGERVDACECDTEYERMDACDYVPCSRRGPARCCHVRRHVTASNARAHTRTHPGPQGVTSLSLHSYPKIPRIVRTLSRASGWLGGEVQARARRQTSRQKEDRRANRESLRGESWMWHLAICQGSSPW